MTVTTTDVASAVVVTVAGELDLHTAPLLLAALDQALERPGLDTAIVDLSAVTFLGSSGLGVLANLATRATPAHTATVAVRLVAPSGHRPVTRPWRAMNLQPLLPLYPDIAGALDGRGRVER